MNKPCTLDTYSSRVIITAGTNVSTAPALHMRSFHEIAMVLLFESEVTTVSDSALPIGHSYTPPAQGIHVTLPSAIHFVPASHGMHPSRKVTPMYLL